MKEYFKPDITMLAGLLFGAFVVPIILAQVHKRR